jgi:hypothetical protein
MHTPLVNKFLSLGCQTYCAINLPFCFISEYGVIYRMQSIARKEMNEQLFLGLSIM